MQTDRADVVAGKQAQEITHYAQRKDKLQLSDFPQFTVLLVIYYYPDSRLL